MECAAFTSFPIPASLPIPSRSSRVLLQMDGGQQ